MNRRPMIGLVVLTAVLAACEIPQTAPKWGMTWNVPGKGASIAVDNFLPSGVTATPTAFKVNVAGITVTRNLGTDCPLCAVANGTTVPKPAFTGGGTSTTTLPAGITSATLGTSTLTVTITNGFDFDPLRPAAAPASAKGWFTIVVKNGVTQIGKDSVNGADFPLPASGGTLIRNIPLTGTLTSAGGVSVTVTMNSPAGDAVLINSSQNISFVAAATTANIASATVSLASQPITSTPDTIDLSGIDSSITSRVDSGSFFLSVTNPFGATGTLSVTFSPSGGTPITKSIALTAPGPTVVSADTLSFTATQLRSLLHHKVVLSFTGTVNGATVTVTPGQTVTVNSRLQMTVETTGN